MNMDNLPSHHLSEDALFEFIDQALPKDRLDEIETHLEACKTCRERLSEFNALFSTVETLPDEPIMRDLTPEVLTAIKRGAVLAPIWWWLLILQGILALGLIAITVPFIFNSPLTNSLLENGRDILAMLSTNLSYWLQEWFSLIGTTSQLFSVRLPLSLGIPIQPILWLLLLATVTWIVGNSILLRTQLTQSEQ